ncbi:MAG: hypothetical protein O8C67_15215 [Candidatus Methanoperedens sp.]|nr:hypothetical protein [Candidatus Methanoperedens sp.]
MDTEHGNQELELSIRTEKSRYTVGETVRLEISLRNAGSKTVKTPKYFMLPADDPNKNNLEIQVHDAAGNRLSRISHVMTGRALYYPDIFSINPGETYLDSFQLAGTFARKIGSKEIKKALWSLGENPEITSLNEYPIMTRGTFKVQVIYHVDKKHLISLGEAESSDVWTGQLISNIIEIFIK